MQDNQNLHFLRIRSVSSLLRGKERSRIVLEMGYADPPWEFQGKALYQLSLVRVEDARKYVPAHIPLVQIFGYTLGGLYLARYTDSPAGPFDELVALAGLAWNFPTSCAWAARVYVNNVSARNHGLQVVGLPSRLASFRAVPRKSLNTKEAREKAHRQDWWSLSGMRGAKKVAEGVEYLEIHNKETGNKGLKGKPVCSIEMPADTSSGWKPSIQMFLPSYSGATTLCPDVLKYSLRMFTKVSFTSPLVVRAAESDQESSMEALGSVLCGKPLICMSFDSMKIHVGKPEIVPIQQ